MAGINTLYIVLGLEPSASTEEIEAAYARARQTGQGDANEASLQRIAYETLRDPDQRAAYDRKLVSQVASDMAVLSHHGPARGGGGKLRLLIVVIVMAGAAYGWHSQRVKRLVPETPDAGVPPMASVAERPSPAEADAVLDYVPLPTPTPASGATASAGEGATPAAMEVIMPTRGERKAAFDPEYLAWSSFQIRQRRSSGSGVLIGPDRILTNCHVLAGGAMGIVVIHSLTKRVTKVEKYARLEGEDACLLYAPDAGGEVIEWGNSAELKPGDKVYTLGHPGGSRDLIWSEANYLGPATIGGNAYLQSANYCRPGSSGGPLLDSQGRLVGIVTSGQVRVRDGETQYGACNSLTDASARQLLSKSLFPIGLAPAKFYGNN